MRKFYGKVVGKVALAVGLVLAAVAPVPAMATSIVDYATLGTAVSGELTAGIAAAVATVGIIWGAKIGLNFVRSMLH